MASTITVDFNANVARFTSSVDKMTNDLSRFQSNAERTSKNINNVLGNIGVGLSVAGVVAFGKSVIDNLDHLNNLSKTTGLAVDKLAGLGVVAKKSGSDLDSIASSVDKLSVNFSKNEDKFRKLGITAQDPLDRFKQLSDIFVSIKNSSDREGVAAVALGKSWEGAAPALALGSTELGRMVEEGAKASGITTEMTQEAEDFNSKLVDMKTQLTGVTSKIAGEFLPAMTSMLAKLNSASKSGGIFGFFTADNNEEAQAAATIESMRLKVETLTKLRDELTKPTLANKINNTLLGSLLSGGMSDIKNLDSQIAAAETKISYLQGLVKTTTEKTGEEGKPPANVNPPKPGDIKNFLGSENAEATMKAALANRLKLLDDNVAQEKTLLDSRNKILDLYNSENVISLKDYYGARKLAQDEGVKNSLAAYDKEIAALQKFIKGASKETDRTEATGKVNAILEKKSKLVQDASTDSIAASINEQKAFVDLAKKIGSVNASVLEFEGHLREAALIRFDQTNDDLTKRFTAEGNTTAIKRLAILREYTAAQAELNQISVQSSAVTTDLAGAELRINVARQSGALTELSALSQLGTERQKAVDQLKVMYDNYTRIANASGNPKLIQDAKNLQTQLAGLAAQTNLVGQKFQTLFADSASQAMVQFSQGTVTAAGAFKLFANSILSELVRLTTQAAAMKLFGGLFGNNGSGQTGISILGSLLGAFGGSKSFTGPSSITSGGLTGFAANGAYFDGSVAKFAMGDIFNSPTAFKFASGGAIKNGIMGEAGPEAIMPLQRGPDGKLGVSGGGKGVSINYAPVVNIDSRSDRASIIQDMQRVNKQGQADLVDKLTRQGLL